MIKYVLRIVGVFLSVLGAQYLFRQFDFFKTGNDGSISIVEALVATVVILFIMSGKQLIMGHTNDNESKRTMDR